MAKEEPKKPEMVLMDGKKALTLEGVQAAFEGLTGRKMTEAELADARQKLEAHAKSKT